MPTFTKDPEAILDYYIQWSTWLDGDTISTSEWTVPDGITEDSDAKTSAGLITIWLSGGALDANYQLVNHIVTAAGREEDQTITIAMRAK
jgi:hypothetical protein